MQIDIVVGFFILGAVAHALKGDLRLPTGLYQTCLIFLLLAIGLKGGVSLSQYELLDILPQSLAIIAFGALLPFIAFPILFYIGGWSRVDSAATAAHYGSVSVATYAVAIAFLEVRGIPYESYFPLFVALLEVPAIIIGILLAKRGFGGTPLIPILREALLNKGVLLLLGGLAIGAWAGERASSVLPLFGDLFHGMLALFLLEMGGIAASKTAGLRKQGAFLLSFALLMPLLGALGAGILACLLDLSNGGTLLLVVLGSSASYIAVPAAMSVALPEANASTSITASLAITFPFNVIVAIPVYWGLITYLR